VTKRHCHGRYDLVDDLVSDGNMGLLHAAERYDENRSSFTTYSALWIRLYVERALYNEWFRGPSRVPISTITLIPAVTQVETRLTELLDRVPTDEEILLAIHAEKPDSRTTELFIKHIRNDRPTVSLHASQPEFRQRGSRRRVLDDIQDIGTLYPELAVQAREALPLAQQALKLIHTYLAKNVHARFVYILDHRLGLNGDKCESLAQIGVSLCLSRERVRQLESLALERLRLAFDVMGPDLKLLHAAVPQLERMATEGAGHDPDTDLAPDTIERVAMIGHNILKYKGADLPVLEEPKPRAIVEGKNAWKRAADAKRQHTTQDPPLAQAI